ncbi:AraC family transcriptional regulator [Scleromatobacter humisilvae]|uniref:AraC family transcriptional regulator n=1 Tax=Scleromatobacter humisilvae TaxID=2897159 RepID=A0A9X1YKY3_9BURK|nr:AraC family transcriptional regulator [Scleromatobacter humisilvae]MCK9687642.1 AraC family transcriptional regulator [Scleromatobacter humisilvae]
MLNLTRTALIALGLCAAAALSPVFAAGAPAAAASAPLPADVGAAMPAVTTATAPVAAAPAPESAASAAAPAPDSPASAAAAAEPAPTGSLDDRVQQTKADVIRLNRDLLVLEEELLFPANTQVAVFVSMDVGLLFDLDSVQIKLDDKVVTTYLYTPLEVQALHRGGVQRVYLGDLKAGSHEIVAFFTGKGPHDRDYKRATTIKFDKATEPKYIELQIKDVQQKLQPEFDVKVWQ